MSLYAFYIIYAILYHIILFMSSVSECVFLGFSI